MPKQLDRSAFLVGVTAGSGSVAAITAHGGADFLLAINAARLRNMGAPSIACMLPLADALRQVEAYARSEVLSSANLPVLVGVNCWQHGFDPLAHSRNLLREGFAGVVNFPPCALYPTVVQHQLESAGVGFSAELDMLARAQEAGAIALAYCQTVSQGRQAALAGIGHILLNLGWNTGGILSPSADLPLSEAAVLASSFATQVRRINPEAAVFLEGGPVETSDDLAFIRSHARLDGYIGGSTFERLPVERSITDRIALFKLSDGRVRSDEQGDRNLLSFGESVGLVGRSPALQNALAKLQVARREKQPFLFVSVPEGDSLEPPLKALTRGRGGRNPEWVVDFTVDAAIGHRQLRADLFGERGRSGHLSDPKLDLLILRYPERLTRAQQKHLASVVLNRVVSSGMAGPRVICVGHFRLPDKGGALAAELAELLVSNQIVLPPLRDRGEDLAALLTQAVGAATCGSQAPRTFSPAALRRLYSYDWPGNTAELVSLCTHLAQHRTARLIPLDEIDRLLEARSRAFMRKAPAPGGQKQVLVDALIRNRFRKGQTADALGISRKTLYNWMKRHGLG